MTNRDILAWALHIAACLCIGIVLAEVALAIR